MVTFPLCKPVLDRDILPLSPPKLGQLLSERVHKDRATGSSAWIQVAYAEDFPRLLRLCWKTKRKEQSAKRKTKECFSHVFSLVLAADARRRVSDDAVGQEKPPNVSDKSSTNDYNEQLSLLFRTVLCCHPEQKAKDLFLLSERKARASQNCHEKAKQILRRRAPQNDIQP